MKKRLFGILLSFALMLTMMPVLGLSQTAKATTTTTVTWNSKDFTAQYTTSKDGISIIGGHVWKKSDEIDFRGLNSKSISNGSFTTDLGNFTSVTVSGGWRDPSGRFPGSGTDWDGDTWTGNSSTVPISGRMTDDEGTNPWTITFTIALKEPVTYPLWVGGTQVTSANKDDPGNRGWSYTPADGTTPAKLTLNNYTYTSSSGNYEYSAIYANENLILELEGTNNVDSTLVEGNDNAIFVNDQLNVQGEGSLDAKGKRYGIYAYKGLTIEGCNVIARSTETTEGEKIYRGISSGNIGDDITIKNATVKANAVVGNAIDSGGDVIIENSTVEAHSTNHIGVSSYEDNNVEIKDGSNVIASGGDKAIDGTVKNAIAGTGWTDTEGKEGKTAIAINTEGKELTFKKVQFPAFEPVASVTTSGGTETEYTDFAEAVNAWNTAGAGATLTLLADVETSSTVSVTAFATNSPMVLDLNGYGIRYTGSSGSVINIKDPGELKLKDNNTSSHTHYIMLNENGRGISVADSGTESATCIKVTGGYITGGNTSDNGGGVCDANGNFTMEGGTIVGNTADNGGGVWLGGTNPTFTMNGGTITANTATSGGGGVYVNGGSFNMKGGTISGNKAKSNGGGVYVNTRGTFNLSSGTISDNTANKGGGVFNSGTFNLSGNSEIINNNAAGNYGHGGGVYNSAGGTFNMNSGKIQGNEANYYAGVSVDGGTFNMTNGEIDSNIASNGIGGVYVHGSATFEMTGGKVENNKAANDCGGVYALGTFNLSGDAVIKDNLKGFDKSNVYLPDGKKITVTGALGENASIGVTMKTPGVFTSSTGTIKASDYKGCFSSDDSTYSVMTTEDNELKLSAHEHIFTYKASGDTITATCSAEGCPLPPSTQGGSDHVAKLTIAAPKHTTYGDGKEAAAQITDENKIQGTAVVKYYNTDAEGKKTGDPLSAAPTDAGKYWAEITLGPEGKTATAHVVYTIAKATPTITAVPTAAAITYGQKLSDSKLTGGTASVGDLGILGAFTWKDGTIKPSVADSETTDYDVVFTPNDSANYNTAECKVKLTVNPKEVGLSWTNTNLTYNGQQQAPTATATGLVSSDEGKVSVTVTGGQTNARTEAYTATANGLTGDKADNYTLPAEKTKSFTISPKPISGATVTLSETSLDYTGTEQSVSVTSVKLDGTELSADTDYTVSGNTGTDVGTYTVTVTGTGNYTSSATTQWSITATPTIDPAPSASDITYGQTLSDSKLTGGKAKVGDTEVPGTFSWKNGSTRPSVDDSGKTEYTVVFTPTDTTKYKPAETKVKLTVNKGEPTAAAVTANNRKYDGTKKPLVTVDESILVGGTMQYALGKDAKTAPEEGWGESIPEAAEKGEYYVWYQVKGDANHKDSAPQAVTVTISEKDPEPNESTITFDLNGGSLNGKTGKVTVTAANGTVITLPEPTRDGYTFDYWEGSRYNAGDQYTVNGDHTFKAVWKTGAGGNGSKGGSAKNGVNTGDENTLGAWIVLLIAALTGTTGMAFARKRRDD